MYKILAVFEAVDKVSRVAQSIGKNVQGLAGKVDRAGARMQRVGASMTAGITAPILAMGTAAIDAASDLDREMRNIQSVSKGTDSEIADLSRTFVEMSMDITKTTDTAEGLAAGFYDIQGSGFAGAAGMTVLEAATMAASAGLTRTEVSSKALAATLNAYSMEADQAGRVSDLLFRTVDIGVGSFEELGSSVGGVVGTASIAGVKFETVSAALATMSKAGISFAEGGTALNQMIMGFIKPSEEMVSLLEDAGYASGTAAIEALGLSGALGLILDETGGTAEAMATLFPNVRALKAALSLTRGEMGPFTADLEAMANSAGATQAAYEIQTRSFKAQTTSLMNVVKGLAITLGNDLLPMGLDLINMVKPWILQFTQLDEGTKRLIITVAGVAAALGPVLLVGGSILRVLSPIIGLIGSLLPLLASIAPVILPAVAVAGALYLAWETNFAGIRDLVVQAGAVIKPVISAIVEAVEKVVAVFREGGLGPALVEVRTQFVALGPKVLGALETLGRMALEWITEQVPRLANKLVKWGQEVVAWVGPQIPPLLAKLGELAGSVLGWLGEQIPELIVKLLEWGTEFVEWIGPQIPPLLAELGRLLSEMALWMYGTALPEIIGKLLEWGVAFVDWVFTEAIPKIVPALWEFLTTVTLWLVNDAVPAVVSAAIEVGKGIVEGMKTGVKQIAGSLLDAAKGVVSSAIEGAKKLLGISSPSKVFASIGSDMMLGMAQGIEESGDIPVEKVTGLLDDLVSQAASIAEGLGRIGGYEGTGTWTSFGVYVMPGLDALERDLRLVVARMTGLSAEFDAEGVTATADFSESVGKMGGGIGKMLDPLTDLQEYAGAGTWTPFGQYVVPGLDALERDLRLVVPRMTTLSSEFEAEGVTAAADLAESGGRMAKGIGEMLEPLSALSEYSGAGTWTSFGVYVMPGLLALESDLRLVVARMTTLSGEFDAEALTPVAAFVDTAAEIAGGVEDAGASLARIAEYSAAGPEAIDAFAVDVRYVTSVVGDVTSEVASELLPESERFKMLLEKVQRACSLALVGFGDLRGLATGVDVLRDLTRAGGDMMLSLAKGIRSNARVVVDAFDDTFRRVRDMLPGSDPKAGPLRGLSQMGRMIPEVLARGVDAGSNRMAEAMAGMMGLTPAYATATVRPMIGSASGTSGDGAVHRHYELEYHAHRSEPGEADAAAMMREIEFVARTSL